ncbi:hypothetical protein AVEN_55888-1 [Araneus ventricosus]|uniref:Uncharacterized protein n=1 Tax=Araneus ventricosus TaxID=182803 RepID=A0A4Y2R8T3_ARAVE|nr:hypothetical protein AVEN_55888-1 [Araneus ventricosus]
MFVCWFVILKEKNRRRDFDEFPCFKRAIQRSIFGIFGTRGGKPIVNVENLRNLQQTIEVVELQRTQNPKLHPPIPILDLDEKVAVKQRICLHWDLASRLEMELEIPRFGEEECGWKEFYDFESCLKTNFGTSVNVLPNFSTKKGGIQTSC